MVNCWIQDTLNDHVQTVQSVPTSWGFGFDWILNSAWKRDVELTEDIE